MLIHTGRSAHIGLRSERVQEVHQFLVSLPSMNQTGREWAHLGNADTLDRARALTTMALARADEGWLPATLPQARHASRWGRDSGRSGLALVGRPRQTTETPQERTLADFCRDTCACPPYESGVKPEPLARKVAGESSGVAIVVYQRWPNRLVGRHPAGLRPWRDPLRDCLRLVDGRLRDHPRAGDHPETRQGPLRLSAPDRV